MEAAPTQHQTNGASAELAVPTEECPSTGRVSIEGEVISSATYWVADDGAHVIASTEFDLHGVGSDLPAALESFWLHAVDLFEYLANLPTSSRTDEEREVAATLGPRIISAYENQNKRLREAIDLLQSRRNSLLNGLHLRRRALVESTRRNAWDPDRRMRENSRTPLPV
jgi:hypothetical protein